MDRPSLWAADVSVPTKLPWDELEFSRRMLAEHLAQRHDKASRRVEIVAAQVDWIFEEILDCRPGAVLDMGCGPGLYTERFAQLGCRCVGIDFSPTAIEYARQTATTLDLDCTYRLDDLASAGLGSGHDLATLMFGEFNTFERVTASDLRARAWQALGPGGRLLLESHVHDFVVETGPRPRPGPRAVEACSRLDLTLSLSSRHGTNDHPQHAPGMSSSKPTPTQLRFSGRNLRPYTDSQYLDLLTDAGFADVEILRGMGDIIDKVMLVTTARKPECHQNTKPAKLSDRRV